ncbi:erythromycin esterase family protein [Actinomadura rudentiformis]|uniref:Erythromycin esterase family protein n=1 Tax=Actinomadura rudentiformis TaxID=359158 RepID=A0A6H9YUY4_9ACTN|nr:erythromycin esterase family protein [Actinomadura rudentiformis]KAB2352351.1 erythromycin esterase family protein [Actinomadura rudentiformis]
MVVEWIKESSHVLVARDPGEPLDDLRPLAPMVRDANVVALGAAARQTRELSVVAHRVVRLLVEEEGFRSLALEGDDPSRLGLDAYIATGEGDPREMLAGARAFWQTEEILGVIGWMRSYNQRHPDDPVRFAENSGPEARHATPLDGLAGLERALADGVAWWQERTGDKIVYWGGMAHTAVGDPRTISPSSPVATHRNMGGHLREHMGERYRSIGLTLGHGSIGVPLPAPDVQFADSVLAAGADGRAGYFLDLRAPRPEPVGRWLNASTRTRLIGPSYDPADDAAYHMSGGSLAGWFDVVVHTEEVTPVRLLAPLPA